MPLSTFSFIPKVENVYFPAWHNFILNNIYCGSDYDDEILEANMWQYKTGLRFSYKYIMKYYKPCKYFKYICINIKAIYDTWSENRMQQGTMKTRSSILFKTWTKLFVYIYV